MISSSRSYVLTALLVMLGLNASGRSDEPPIVAPMVPQSLIMLPVSPSIIVDAALSPDGSALVTGSEDGELIVWYTKDGSRRRTLRPGPSREPVPDHPGFDDWPSRDPNYRFWPLFPVAFSASGSTIAASTQLGIEDKTPTQKAMSLVYLSMGTVVEIWNVADGRNVAVIDTKYSGLTSLAVEPSGARIVAINTQSEALTWVIDSRQLVDRFGAVEEDDVNSAQEAITFDRAASHAASVLPKYGDPMPVPQLRLWDLKTRSFRRIDPRERGWLEKGGSFGAVTFNSDGTRIAAAANSTILLIDFATATVTGKLIVPKGFAQSRLAFRSDGRQLIAVNREGVARVYDLTTHTLAWSARGPVGEARAIHWFEDRVLIVTGGLLSEGKMTPVTLYSLAIPKP